MISTNPTGPTPHTAATGDGSILGRDFEATLERCFAATLERDFEAAVDRACGGGPLEELEPDEPELDEPELDEDTET